jgi:hypothetical protein
MKAAVLDPATKEILKPEVSINYGVFINTIIQFSDRRSRHLSCREADQQSTCYT